MIKVLFITLIFLIPFMSTAKSTKITYKLSMPEPQSHIFEVQMKLDQVNEKDIELILPVWRPGRYFIFDFASGVFDFNVMDENNKSLLWKKINKCTWKIETANSKNITVSYKVFANETGLRTRGLDENHGFVNGAAVFMYAEKYRKLPLELEVVPFGDWHVTTGLESSEGKPNQFTAPDYDYFVDCPLEIGNQTDFDFDVDGKKHVISFFGEANYDRQKLIDDFTKIIRKNYELWDFIPYDRYIFIVHCGPQSGGGTEHINSTVVGVKPETLENDQLYIDFLRLISHEFFHTWNVKQIRPKGITPYDYTKENYTEELWVAEGGTSYYDGLMLLRTGQYKVQDFYDEIANAVEQDRRRPGNKVQSLAESSFDAWVKFWKNTSNKLNMESDYYVKGSHVSMILDLEIRNRTDNKKTLDEVFTTLLERYPLGSSGYTNHDFRLICEDITGTSFKEFFDKYVYGTDEINWEEFLSYAGLKLASNDSTIQPVVGIYASQHGDKVIIDEVAKGSSAEDCGLQAGDEITAVDSVRLSYQELENKLTALEEGQKVEFIVFREKKLKKVILTLQNRKVPNYLVVPELSSTEKQIRIYEDWLKTGWNGNN
ncbi:MAG: M61 family peptidase [Ignavibacteriae bacterium]|nr:MAG: M61 family peptidase [Ignavibacteriota bacterium]